MLGPVAAAAVPVPEPVSFVAPLLVPEPVSPADAPVPEPVSHAAVLASELVSPAAVPEPVSTSSVLPEENASPAEEDDVPPVQGAPPKRRRWGKGPE